MGTTHGQASIGRVRIGEEPLAGWIAGEGGYSHPPPDLPFSIVSLADFRNSKKRIYMYLAHLGHEEVEGILCSRMCVVLGKKKRKEKVLCDPERKVMD